MQAINELAAALKARLPCVHLRTLEETRAIEALRQTIQQISGTVVPRVLWRWSSASGIWQLDISDQRSDNQTNDPCSFDEAMSLFRKSNENVVLALLDPWDELSRPVYLRYFREALEHARGNGKALILVGRDWQVPPEVASDIFLCDLRLPSRAELREFINSLCVLYAERLAGKVTIEEKTIPEMARACCGLTLDETKSIVALSLVRFKSIGTDSIAMAIREKRQIVRRTGVLEYEEAGQQGLEQVGGLSELKGWIVKRGKLFNEEARNFGINAPKGVLVVGVPGTGKSLCARAISVAWQMPLVRLDVGRLFGSLVGESESNLRLALRTAEAIAPAVLLVDELEKAFAGGGLDGGTSQRVFGTFLSWLQDKKSEIFVVATANQIDKLPPELLRKGRFDEIFFADLPDEKSRAEILNIHLTRAGQKTEKTIIERLAVLSRGFSGAEIEAAVQHALIEAFSQQRSMKSDDLELAMKTTVALSKTMNERVEALQEFCRSGRALRAGGALDSDKNGRTAERAIVEV